MKPQFFRILGWLIPALCIGMAGGLIYHENSELLAAGKLRNEKRIEVEKATEQRHAIENIPLEHNYAAVPETKTEESGFLDYLKARAALCGVDVVDWTSQTDDYGKSTSKSPEDQKADQLLKGLRRISSTVTVRGSYEGLRAMVMQLESSDRLYTLSSPKWMRSPTGTTLTVVIARYVVPEKSNSGAAPSGHTPGIRIS